MALSSDSLSNSIVSEHNLFTPNVKVHFVEFELRNVEGYNSFPAQQALFVQQNRICSVFGISFGLAKQITLTGRYEE